MSDEMPTAQEKAVLAKELLCYINETPALLSLLYDMDLMPEQLNGSTFEWRQMLILAVWHKRHFTPHAVTPKA